MVRNYYIFGCYFRTRFKQSWLIRLSGEFGYSWHHWAYKRYGCITGDNAGFFHIDGDFQLRTFLSTNRTSGCTKCEGGMDECLNTEAVLEYSRWPFPRHPRAGKLLKAHIYFCQDISCCNSRPGWLLPLWHWNKRSCEISDSFSHNEYKTHENKLLQCNNTDFDISMKITSDCYTEIDYESAIEKLICPGVGVHSRPHSWTANSAEGSSCLALHKRIHNSGFMLIFLSKEK